MRGRKTKVLPEKDRHKGVKCPDIPPNGGLTPSCRNFGDRRKEDLENAMVYLKKALKEGTLLSSEIRVGIPSDLSSRSVESDEDTVQVVNTVTFRVADTITVGEYFSMWKFRNLHKRNNG